MKEYRLLACRIVSGVGEIWHGKEAKRVLQVKGCRDISACSVEHYNGRRAIDIAKCRYLQVVISGCGSDAYCARTNKTAIVREGPEARRYLYSIAIEVKESTIRI